MLWDGVLRKRTESASVINELRRDSRDLPHTADLRGADSRPTERHFRLASEVSKAPSKAHAAPVSYDRGHYRCSLEGRKEVMPLASQIGQGSRMCRTMIKSRMCRTVMKSVATTWGAVALGNVFHVQQMVLVVLMPAGRIAAERTSSLRNRLLPKRRRLLRMTQARSQPPRLRAGCRRCKARRASDRSCGGCATAPRCASHAW